MKLCIVSDVAQWKVLIMFSHSNPDHVVHSLDIHRQFEFKIKNSDIVEHTFTTFRPIGLRPPGTCTLHVLPINNVHLYV